ncbi:MAG: DUF4388 domain-containing protein [bacterium]|nr:DUF4388 domain-containing protein [bacterium]MCP5071297.1 DUF4388 domain-containing protein [bacterium]
MTSSSILVVQLVSNRARQLADACATRGFETSFASNGATALEAALTNVPDVMVAAADLDLIEAETLVEILRANPRTQGVRFLFLGHSPLGREPQGRNSAGSFFDDSLPLSASAEEIALRIEAILAQRKRIDAVDREAEAEQAVQGKLSQIPLTDLLQLFHMNQRTGTIELTRQEGGAQGEHGALVLREGNLIQATVGRVEGEKALFRLLAWRDGGFAFRPGTVTMAPRITTPTRALLMEALRQLDEWDQLKGSLPAPSARVRMIVPREELPNAVHPVTQELLDLLEHDDRVGELMDRSAFPDYQVLRTLQALSDRGIVQLRREPAYGEAGRSDALFEPAQQQRLREWLQSGRPRGAPAREAKLLLAAADASVAREFVRLLAALPGFRLEPGFRNEQIRQDDLATLGRLDVDDSVGIQLLHVPTAKRFEACWPVLAQGSLGTILLMDSPQREGEERLRPLVERIRTQRADARIFHVFMLPKGEKLAAAELQPSLGLLDQASVFLLPLEGDRDPVTLLRAVFARILP